MNDDLQLKLQSYADGELSARDRHAVEELLSANAEARALLTELRHTRQALAGFEGELNLPESREFYWSGIARRIELAGSRNPAASPVAWIRVWRRFLLPAGAMAALALAALLAGVYARQPVAAEVEVAMADSDPFTYHDYANGTTLVWLSYPAENDFADIDSDDSLD